MRIERRVANPTSIYKRSCPKLLDRSTVQTPTGVSHALKLRSPLFPKTSTNQSFVLRTQRPSKANKNNEQPPTDSHASSKEKLLLGRIIALKKERNELSTVIQEKEITFKKKLKKLQTENNSLKIVLRKIIPFVSSSISPRSKIQVQSLLEDNENNTAADCGVQCALVTSGNELNSNKASTEAQSADSQNDSTLIRVPKTDLHKFKEDSSEKECLKAYIEYVTKKKKAMNKNMDCNLFPSFITSLYLPN